MVSYCTSDFSHESATAIFNQHQAEKNRKLESYTETDYDFFFANQTINEDDNPFLVYKTKETEDKINKAQAKLTNLEQKINQFAKRSETAIFKLPKPNFDQMIFEPKHDKRQKLDLPIP